MTRSAPQLSARKFGAFVAFMFLGAITIGAQNTHRAHLSDDLLRHVASHATSRVDVIVPGSREDIESVVARHGGAVVKWLATGAVVRANGDEISRLASDLRLDDISGDLPVHAGLSVSNIALAADQTRAGTPGILGIGGISPVDGQKIGVAIVDSGISPHTALGKRVVANVSFVTGDSSTADAYGHGTHVAGIVAGAATNVTSLYTSGIAPGVQLINVRVLGANGGGYTSDVIRGIDWAVDHAAQYNIRVINLSVGHPVMESSATDPLCLAVARAVNAGIVVVAAAGNYGRSPDGHRILGGITSPGNSPLALTVGATDTHGTGNRSDDTLADYSSRGPTKYDFAAKPDLAAPGSKIVSLEAAGSYLISTYPYLYRAGSGTNAYMALSGTSMAAPMISGAAALLLQGSPGLSPAQVKLALQSGASYMSSVGLMGAGAGSANVWNARKITINGLASILTSTLNTLIGGILAPPSGASFWDAGNLSKNLYKHTGIRLLSSLDLSRIWADPSLVNYGQVNLAGLLNPLSLVGSNTMMYGGVTSAMADDDEIIWGTNVHGSDGDVTWGTSEDGDEIIWGTNDSSTLTDPNPQ